MASYDIIGNIAIVKSEYNGRKKSKRILLAEAKKLLKQNSIKTVLVKMGNVKGRLRIIKLKHVLGKKNFIADYKENNCRFKFDVRTCYFSPRLSNDRKEVAMKVKKKDRVLVMFSGVGVYPIIINKYKNPVKIIGVELGKECNKYARENLKINRMEEIELIQGDVKKKTKKGLGKFDVIMMARPNLKDSFLESALIVSKKGTRIFYHAFCRDNEIDNVCENLVNEAKDLKRKVRIQKKIFAGEIAPYKHRYRIEIIVG